jgi:hypothetical protein
VTSAQVESRAARLRDYEAMLAQARRLVDVMGVLVRGREARGAADEPPEETFAAVHSEDGRALPAAVWVGLRRDDTTTVLDSLTAVACETFLICEREEIGEGYRLQTVAETRPVPDTALLLAQLSGALGIPVDVLSVLGDWGTDDPRTTSEIEALLTSRFGGADGAAGAPAEPEPPRQRRAAAARRPGELTMTVQETADVLQLTPAQAKVLATLVRKAGVTITR